MARRAVVAALASVVLLASPGAATYLVRPDRTGDYPTIRAAVDAAVDGDVILLGAGVFRGEGNWDVEILYKDLLIASEPGDPSLTVIDCERNEGRRHRAFLVFACDQVVIRSVTMTNAEVVDAVGGAVSIREAGATLENCVFARNKAFASGAIAAA